MITDIWRDKTSRTIDCGSWSSRFLDFDIIQGVAQATNKAKVYYDVGSSATYENTTSSSKYGERNGMMGTWVDKHIGDCVEAQAVGSSIVQRYGGEDYILDLYFMGNFTRLRPADLVSLSLPHLKIGGDYDTVHASWTAATVAIIEREWDSDTCVVRLRINETWDDGGNTIGRQHFPYFVKDQNLATHARSISAQANQI